MNWFAEIVKSFFNLIGTIFKWSVLLIIFSYIALVLLESGVSLDALLV
jgi:hypothetical protein